MQLRVRGFHLLRRNVPVPSTHCTSCHGAVLQPRLHRNAGGLGSSPFARHYWGNHCLFSLPTGTKMFQFPAFASAKLSRYQVFNLMGCPIRKSWGQRSFAPNPSLSQLITSFIACESQGIRHSPFPTFARALSSIKGKHRLIILSAEIFL